MTKIDQFTDAEIDFEYLKWLNKMRFRTQHRNVGLLEAIGSSDGRIFYMKSDNISWFMFSQSLLGANFSFWRAIFLARRRPQSIEDSYKAMINFLRPLAFDNSVSFQRDVDAEPWALGYYMNNCLARLQHPVINSVETLGKYKKSWVSESPEYENIKSWPPVFGAHQSPDNITTAKENRDKLGQMSIVLDFLCAKLPYWNSKTQ